MYNLRVVRMFWEDKHGLLYDTSIHQHNAFVISGNVAYNKPTEMGHGMYRKDYPSQYAVDGNVDAAMGHHHCAFVQNSGPLSHAWVVDLGDSFDVDKIILYASSSECI